MRNQNQMLSDNESRSSLHGKVAVIFGAGGAIGNRVASEFSHEGASVFLSGRRLNRIEKIAKEIRISNGKADAAEVDALDEKDVNAYLDRGGTQIRSSGPLNAGSSGGGGASDSPGSDNPRLTGWLAGFGGQSTIIICGAVTFGAINDYENKITIGISI